MTDEIFRGMDKSQITLLTLSGLSRCFDVILHQTLLDKLKLMKISTGRLNSYLHGNVHQSKLEKTSPSLFPSLLGFFRALALVPYYVTSRAAILHPSHINNLKATVVRYADDAKIAVTCLQEKLRDHQMGMEMLLKTLGHWFEQHGTVFYEYEIECCKN